MLTAVRTGQFRRDVKRLARRGENLAKLRGLLDLLLDGQLLPASYKDHPLRGDWIGFRDCHIAPDWLLIYRVVDGEL